MSQVENLVDQIVINYKNTYTDDIIALRVNADYSSNSKNSNCENPNVLLLLKTNKVIEGEYYKTDDENFKYGETTLTEFDNLNDAIVKFLLVAKLNKHHIVDTEYMYDGDYNVIELSTVNNEHFHIFNDKYNDVFLKSCQ